MQNDQSMTALPIVVYTSETARLIMALKRNETTHIGQVGMTSLQVNCSLDEVNASAFIAVL